MDHFIVSNALLCSPYCDYCPLLDYEGNIIYDVNYISGNYNVVDPFKTTEYVIVENPALDPNSNEISYLVPNDYIETGGFIESNDFTDLSIYL